MFKLVFEYAGDCHIHSGCEIAWTELVLASGQVNSSLPKLTLGCGECRLCMVSIYGPLHTVSSHSANSAPCHKLRYCRPSLRCRTTRFSGDRYGENWQWSLPRRRKNMNIGYVFVRSSRFGLPLLCSTLIRIYRSGKPRKNSNADQMGKVNSAMAKIWPNDISFSLPTRISWPCNLSVTNS